MIHNRLLYSQNSTTALQPLSFIFSFCSFSTLRFLFVLMCFCALLTSCSSHVKRGDGPPNFHVDETKIPNAKPRAEKLSKCGNMRSYVIAGKRYYVMRSSKNYSAVGVASWYGTMFHTRKTSSGETYNMLGMTAAHKSLPLPTYVRVTNLKNHREIIVKVNDRGPFKANRIIDLSYVAAKKLDMLGKGTAPVRVTAIDPLQPYRTHRVLMAHNKKPARHLASAWKVVKRKPLPVVPVITAIQAHNHPIYLQVGAFANKANARKLQKKLAGLLKTNVIITPPLGSKAYFRVKIGPFKDIATANKLSVRLKHLGIAANKMYGV